MIPFLMRNWQAVIGGLAVAFLAILLNIRTSQRDDARRDASDCHRNHALFVARSAAEAARVRADFEARARHTEADQNRVSQEVSHDYQARLAALRADYERRLRSRPGGSGQPGPPGVPAVPGGAGGSDDPTAPVDPFACRANSLQLDFLQRWVREQQAIEPPHTD